MRRAIAAALALFATLSHAVSIKIDPAALEFTPAEKAAFCGTAPPSCPVDPPVPPTPPGPPQWDGKCSGIQGIDETKVIDLDWDNPPARIYPWNYGGMSPRTAIVMRFNTGPRPLVQYLGRINSSEWSSNPSTRVATLSLKPCDFGLQPATGGRQEGQSINIQFQVQGSTYGGVYYPSLPLNTVVYYNLRNVETPSCAMNNVCDVAIDVHKPAQ